MSGYIWIEGDQDHTSGSNGAITRVVIHATVSPCEKGGARKVARYFQSPNAGGLAHYIVDPGETVQSCREDVACWHAPPNKHSIGVELCDPQSGSAERWYDEPHQLMLARAAVLVADLCKRHHLPVTYLRAADLLAGAQGITMHRDVSAAFKQSSHTDPGVAFPIEHFLDLVRAIHGPSTAEDDDMAITPEGLKQIDALIKSRVDAAVKQLHDENVLILHGNAQDGHVNSIDSIAKQVGVPQP